MRMLAMVLWGVSAVAAAPLDTPASAEACGRCHRAIHEAWRISAHARAMDSRLFQDSLEVAEKDFGHDARRTCLGCHAPIALRTGDLALRNKVSWEGITCDYCHSIRGVSATLKPRVEFTLVKSGPLKDAVSSAHGTQYSAVHTTALACAPCHEYTNGRGLAVLTTYSEWKKSRAGREGRDCQTCHMYRVEGEVVDPRIQRTGEAKINLHQMPGSHSIQQLAGTIKAQLATEREGGALKVLVDVSNQGAGHYVPTGSPLRRIVLELRADTYDGLHFTEQRVYARRTATADGVEINREPVVFIKGAKVLSDTRLAPDERRRETFSFPIPPGATTQLNATFWYYYSPLAKAEAQKRVTFLTLSRLVK